MDEDEAVEIAVDEAMAEGSIEPWSDKVELLEIEDADDDETAVALVEIINTTERQFAELCRIGITRTRFRVPEDVEYPEVVETTLRKRLRGARIADGYIEAVSA